MFQTLMEMPLIHLATQFWSLDPRDIKHNCIRAYFSVGRIGARVK